MITQTGAAVATRREQIRWWALPGLDGAELLDVQNSSRLWRVYHETYSFCFVPPRINNPRSRSHWQYRGRERTLHRGLTMLIEPGELHITKRTYGPPASFRVLQLPPVLVGDLTAEFYSGASPHLRLAQSASPTLMTALEDFYHAMWSHEGPLELQSRLAASLRAVLEYAGERRPHAIPNDYHPALRCARDYLHEHYADPVSLDDLVSVTGLSRFYLLHSFHRAFGLPPHAYQLMLRVTAVRDALCKEGRIPDNLAGFYDQSHLSRHFKRVMGVTPGVYAAAVKPTTI